jgi:hypothetical protein
MRIRELLFYSSISLDIHIKALLIYITSLKDGGLINDYFKDKMNCYRLVPMISLVVLRLNPHAESLCLTKNYKYDNDD